MGITGSITSKAYVDPILSLFTTWGEKELSNVFKRSAYQLSETFALRYHEFTFLIGRNLVGYSVARPMFDRIFDKDKILLVDKLEVLCVLVMLSTLTSDAKVTFIFELFNFNDKGYLTEAETSLMIRTLVTGIYKADPSIGLPTSNTFELYIADALNFAKEKGILLRSELIRFSRLVREAREFMESWRGIASLVLIGDGFRWKDPYFLSMDASITPSRHWLKFGLPPADFVHWTRRNNMGEHGGSLNLFGHTETLLKTADKKVVCGGDGLLGNGTLKQGLLADRWILNAVSMLIMYPCMVKELFASTFQEDVGRFNVRLFEGGGWRSIFVDDRIPCSPHGLSLFASSSDPYECWIQILEKAIAKYLFSYGHLANCSPRPDSCLFALRWLTGGHILKLNVEDFDWSSTDEEALGVNGVAFLEEMLREGAIVSVGRSETQAIPISSCAIYTASLSIVPKPNDCPPYGRLMPIVRVVTDRSGHKRVILRDPWGLESRANATKYEGGFFEGGHARMFSVDIEDLLERYDSLVVCRYPDSLRKHAKSSGLTPWTTVILDADTGGLKNPARFKLVLKSMNKTKENVVKKYGKFQANRHSHLYDAKTEDKSDDFTDVSITLSSAEDWVIVGEQGLAKPQLRLHLMPDKHTLEKIRDKRKVDVATFVSERNEMLRKIKANDNDITDIQSVESIDNQIHGSKIPGLNEEAMNQKTRNTGSVQGRTNLHLNSSTKKELGALPRTYVETTKKGLDGRRSVFSSPLQFLCKPGDRLPTYQMIENESFEYKIRSARSWQSHSFKLLPGTYYILGDVESENTDLVKYGLNLDREREISERSWNECRDDLTGVQRTEGNGTKRLWMHVSSTKNFTLNKCSEEECPGNFDNNQLLLEVHDKILDKKRQIYEKSLELEKCVSQHKQIHAIKDIRILRSKSHIANMNEVKEKISNLNEQIRELELILNEDKRIWRELKTVWMDAKEDAWPFMAETQCDVATRGLAEIIDGMYTEASGMKAVVTAITRQLPRTFKSIEDVTDCVIQSNRLICDNVESLKKGV